MMRLLFLYGPPASGKLTIARRVAEQTGLALFHNHLIVDAVHAVFPFGSDPFVRLREAFWLETFKEAARANRSLIFTFAPEPTVTPGFAARSRDLIRSEGGDTLLVALTVSREAQRARLADPGREAFGKLRDPDFLETLRAGFEQAEAEMPSADLVLDTDRLSPAESAALIAERL